MSKEFTREIGENQKLWDAWTAVNTTSKFYDVRRFLDDPTDVRIEAWERAEVGDVAGKTLLHVQCHFGLDTLSWARLGARVTGVDFSPAAIRLARPVLIRSLLATPPAIVDRADPHEQQRVDRMLEHILPVSERRLGLLNDARITSTLRREPLDRVAAKTLVISVVDDLFGTYDVARFTAAEIPGARFVGYANGGHVWVGHEQEAVMEIEHFLR